MIKEYWRVFKMRRYLRQKQKNEGRCINCGKRKGHEDWCWGPKIHTGLWLVLRHPSLYNIVWKMYRMNLEWAGTEPWHRY